MKKLQYLKNASAQGTADSAQEEEMFKKNTRKHAMEACAEYLQKYCAHLEYKPDAEFALDAASWRESRAKEIADLMKCSPADVLVCVLHNFSPQVRKSHWDCTVQKLRNPA